MTLTRPGTLLKKQVVIVTGAAAWWKWGRLGMELIRTASNQLMLATRPMLLNLERGSQIYSNQQTMNMFKSLPAAPQQIHNMYQSFQ
jgi:hypothetical protein